MIGLNIFLKKKENKINNFKNFDDFVIPTEEMNYLKIENVDYNSNSLGDKNLNINNKDNNQNEINENSHLYTSYKDNSSNRIMKPNKNLIKNINQKKIKFSNDILYPPIKKISFDDSNFIVESNKKINRSTSNINNNYKNNLLEIKKNFSLEDNNKMINVYCTENLKENNFENKKSNSRSFTLKEKHSFTGKSFKSKLELINGNSLIFNFSFFEIIWGSIFFCRKCITRKYNLYEKAYNNINYHLHIYSYLKVIQEIDTMKNATFSTDEIKIINFISKPIISEEDKQEFFNNEDFIKNKLIFEKNLKEVLKAYEKILKKDEIKDNSINLLKSLSFQLTNLTKDEE